MKLYEGKKGSTLKIVRMELPVQTERRLEGTRVTVVNRKKKGAMIVNIRGTRFAIGQCITECIEVEEL